jgi:hypothetical protein
MRNVECVPATHMTRMTRMKYDHQFLWEQRILMRPLFMRIIRVKGTGRA